MQAEAERCAEAVQLMEQPGVGPITALAFVLTVGPVERFPHSRALVSYLGLNPREDSSGGHQRLGHISKQGNQMLRWLLVEAGQRASLLDEELRRKYKRLAFRRGRNVAKVADGSTPGSALVFEAAPGEIGQLVVCMPGSPR